MPQGAMVDQEGGGRFAPPGLRSALDGTAMPVASEVAINVLFISPAHPGDMSLFVGGLAAVGAKVIGLGEQSGPALPAELRR